MLNMHLSTRSCGFEERNSRVERACSRSYGEANHANSAKGGVMRAPCLLGILFSSVQSCSEVDERKKFVRN